MSNRTLATIGLVAALLLLPPSAIGQLPTQDLVTANVATTATGFFQDIQIDARSGPSGENPTGTLFYRFIDGNRFGGPVTCLAVEGNAATIRAEGLAPVHVVDNVGTAAPDTFEVSLVFGDPADCSTFIPSGLFGTDISTLDGVSDIAVVDAQPLPTTQEQCKNGGWQNFPGFKNQGQCVAFADRGS